LIHVQAIAGTTVLCGVASAQHIAIRRRLNDTPGIKSGSAVAFPVVHQQAIVISEVETYLPYSTPKNFEPAQNAAHDLTVNVSLLVALSPSARAPLGSL
jgi:hypothetical protein